MILDAFLLLLVACVSGFAGLNMPGQWAVTVFGVSLMLAVCFLVRDTVRKARAGKSLEKDKAVAIEVRCAMAVALGLGVSMVFSTMSFVQAISGT